MQNWRRRRSVGQIVLWNKSIQNLDMAYPAALGKQFGRGVTALHVGWCECWGVWTVCSCLFAMQILTWQGDAVEIIPP